MPPASDRSDTPAAADVSGREGPLARRGGRGASAWRPVLLSALGFPGLGQLTQRRYPQAAFQGLGSLVLIGLLLQRVYVETQARIPSDPEELAAILLENPSWPLQLAHAIRTDNAGFFAAVTTGLVLLWLVSSADAWLACRRSADVAVEQPPPPRVQ